MINLCECHFTYKDRSSRDYGLIIANIETSRFMPIVGGKTGDFIFNKSIKARYLVGDDYSDTPLSIDIEIVRCDGVALDLQSVREIERWLFTNSVFSKMLIDIEDDEFGETYELVYGQQKRLYFNCRFIHPEKIESDGGIIGFKCTMETDSPMLWQEPVTAYYEFEPPVEITNEYGESMHIIRGDVDGDGRITSHDTYLSLVIATEVLVLGHDGDPLELIGRVIWPMTEPVSLATLIACDMDYTQEDYDNGVTPHPRTSDARQILVKYTSTVAKMPEEVEEVDINGNPVVDVEDLRKFEVPVDSDIDGYTYPTITITVGKIGGTIELTNTSDFRDGVFTSEDRKMVLSNVPPSKKIVLDCSVSSISGISYNKMTKKYFPRLVEGINTFYARGDISALEIEWQNRRFL